MSDSPKISPADAIDALNNLDDYSRMGCGVEPKGDVTLVLQFILQHSKPEDLNDEGTIQILNFFARQYGVTL